MVIADSPRPRKRAKITDAFLPTPEPSSQPEHASKSNAHNDPVSSPLRSTRSKSFMKLGSNSKNTPSTPSKTTRKNNTRHISDFDDSESDLGPVSIRPRKAPSVSANEDESDDEAPMSAQHTKPTAAPISIESDDSDVPVSTSRPRSKRNKPRSPSPAASRSSSVSEENNPAASDQGDSYSNPRTPQKPSKRTKEDLDDDLAFLRSASPPRAKRSAKKNERSNALEQLKRKREKQTKRSNTRDGDSAVEVSSDPSEDDDIEEVFPDAELQEEGYYDDEEDDGFVTDAEDEEGKAELPLEWKLQSAKPAELFVHVVEWMVQKRLNPGFAIHSPVYDLAFKKVDDYAKGMGASKFTSSAWAGPFLRALKARPEIEEARTGQSLDFDRCQACNRTGHPATYEVQFKGGPYSKDTLEDVSDDEEDAIRDDMVPPEETIFHLGKYCMANARTAHTLKHWRRHLYEWVVDWLEEEGYLRDKEIVKRDRWTTKKKEEFANGVVDHMKDIGEVKSLYQAFKAEIETAQEQDVSTNHYWRVASY